ncbi:MAG: hypothetical protein ABIS84_10060 [Arachnia sp.]
MGLQRSVIFLAATLVLGACSTPGNSPSDASSPTDRATATEATSHTSSTPNATTPAESGTPTVPSATPEPSDNEGDAERYAAAVPAFKEYWTVINETYAAGGAPQATDRMRETMTGQMLTFWETAFADWSERGRRYEGSNVVTGATVDGVVLAADSGQATVRFCVDMSATRAFEANDDPLKKDGNFQEGVALLEWVDGRWKVSGFTPESGVVPSC